MGVSVVVVVGTGVLGRGSRKRGRSTSWGQEAHWKETPKVVASSSSLVAVCDEAYDPSCLEETSRAVRPGE